ncbi:hypothetical protein HQ560_11525 [bacterium]|nr:hypothetical protein [bacterium]
MTFRAIVVGLLGAILVASVTYFNDNIMRQTLFVGNFIPHSVYGTLFVFLLVVNPLLGRLKRRWVFTGPEMAIVLAMTLAACAIPGAGLMRFFTNAIMLPHDMEKTRPGWKAEGVLDMVPDYMLAGTSPQVRADDVRDPDAFAMRSAVGLLSSPRSRVWGALSQERRDILALSPPSSAVADALNSLLATRTLYDADAFAGATLAKRAPRLLKREAERCGADCPLRDDGVHHLEPDDLAELNRHLIDAAWPEALTSHEQRRHEELYTFKIGMSQKKRPVGIDRVPWTAWVRPLAFWLPLVAVLLSGCIGLAVVVHRQWSEHEQLPYPIAQFAIALLPAPGETKAALLRSRLFLGSAGAVLAIHMFNYANLWWPQYLMRIPTEFDFSSLQSLSDVLGTGYAAWALFTVRVYFIAVGLAYFVSSEVSLSIGIAAPISVYITCALKHYGVEFAGRGLYSGGPLQVFHLGAYLGIMVMLLYTGRHYYLAVFRKALWPRARIEAPRESVWGARVFLVSACIFVVYLRAIGIDWILAVPYVALSFTLFVVMSRILAETGLFFLEPRWYPCAFLVVAFGIRAVGPTTALLMFLVSTVLLVIPRESLMPFVVNSLKVLDRQKVRVGRGAMWCGAAVVLSLAVAVPVTLMFQYGAGAVTAANWDTWGAHAVPRYSFDKTVELKQRLRIQRQLEPSESVRGLARLGRALPETRSMAGFGLGLTLVVLLAAARLRFAWWPLHPILIIAFASYPGTMLWPSFLIGWFLKRAVVKYGGHRAYRQWSPAMLGLIAGDLLGMLLPSLIGALAYLIYGTPAPSFPIMPS